MKAVTSVSLSPDIDTTHCLVVSLFTLCTPSRTAKMDPARSASTAHRVRFSSASPARHTYSSSGEDLDDKDKHPDPGPSTRKSQPLARQSLPADFRQPSERPLPPPRRIVTPGTALNGVAGPSKPNSNSNPGAISGSGTKASNGTVSHEPRTVVSLSGSPQPTSSEQLEQTSFSALEKSMPKAPPSQRAPSSGFLKSKNPFRRRHTSQPVLSTVIAPSLSAPVMPPPAPPPLQTSGAPVFRSKPASNFGDDPPKATGSKTMITIASGSTSRPPLPPSSAPRLPPRRASVSEPPIAPPIGVSPNQHKKSRTSVASSTSLLQLYQ